jgi:tRNA G10  N-methylase Trm11
LAKDFSIAANGEAGNEHYYVCYLQLFKNENPFYNFQEDKPGWLSMVTTPHSLAAAMINITRRALDQGIERDHKQKVIKFWDPFCSSGTIPFEIAKLGSNVHITASDLMRSTEYIIRDNLMIFSSRATKAAGAENNINDLRQRDTDTFSFDCLLNQLRAIKLDFSQLELTTNCPSTTAPARVVLFWAYNCVRSIVNLYVKDRDYDTEEGQSIKPTLFASLRKLRDIDLLAQDRFLRLLRHDRYNQYWLHRVLLYIVWRCALTNIHEFVDGKDVTALIKKELDQRIRKLQKLVRIHLAERSRLTSNARRFHSLDRVEGQFSHCITLSPERLAGWWNERHVELIVGERGEVRRLAASYQNKFDVIITDPPYGFNTDVECGERQLRFYRELVQVLLTSIKNRGQIIFCLPDESVNGQTVPSYLRKPWVLRELFTQVSILFPNGGRIVEFSCTKPRHGALLFTAPYYWRSKKSLTRTILHLIVEKGPDRDGAAKEEGAENGTPKKQKSSIKVRRGVA